MSKDLRFVTKGAPDIHWWITDYFHKLIQRTAEAIRKEKAAHDDASDEVTS